jgi:hypothetical protein
VPGRAQRIRVESVPFPAEPSEAERLDEQFEALLVERGCGVFEERGEVVDVAAGAGFGLRTAPNAAVEMLCRSWVSSRLAISQPPLSRPTSCSLGTRTSVRKVSQNGESPEMSLIGRVSTPGVRMSNTMNEIPPCFAVVSVRTRQNIQSALSA